jgi:hypothetical protein
MSDLTNGNGTWPLERQRSNPQVVRDEFPLDLSKKTCLKSRISVFELHFAAAC